MKPHLLKVPTEPSHSFSIRLDKIPNINNRWHHHAEVELIHFHRGAGTQFVGDHVKRFGPGDIVLVGANLPHYWRYDDTYFTTQSEEGPFATVIHFTEDFWGDRFLNLPENKPLRTILEKARRGLLLTDESGKSVGALMEGLRQTEGPYRIMGLMNCLLAIARSEDVQLLSSLGFQYDRSDSENERINAIYEYTLNHFREKISLDAIAGVARLVPNSFCRYFKSRAGKTYSQFLTEIRIGHACKLLIDKQVDVKQICYESGFNNSSCFHQRFKAVTGKSPQSYRLAYSDKLN
ncbi:AraC family transcriptional regulator [Spirosoma endbachense]|uniref:Helix-turn-helix domain-containing protein n=1 Tax=Spirosoma endbachense TaxID=2666025 RepID=A0A6P1W3U4_9BACT|nr:AraC family transcriptional regulator [Spirosoma endbachense]QHV98669.1 helix-turn-helix domain-containing protein [Spirosoma endbachense]